MINFPLMYQCLYNTYVLLLYICLTIVCLPTIIRSNHFTVIIPDSKSVQAPVYLQGIMPTEEDQSSPPPPPSSSDVIATDNDQEDTTMDITDTTLDESTTLHDGAKKDETEVASDNPFLRPPKRMKLKLKL